MNVRELNSEELLQLKEELHDGTAVFPVMTEDQKKICDAAVTSKDIPDDLVYEVYDGINFVKEDFWCNVWCNTTEER